MDSKKILLSFDVEEFDTPLEFGKNLALKDQLEYSYHGLLAVLSLLEKEQVCATFFTTANFALHFPELIKKISETHEIASHGYYHSSFKNEDLEISRKVLKKITGKEIYGYRMARMMPVDNQTIIDAGYLYNASLHPTYIPGRYNNFHKPRQPFMTGTLLQIPASVTPNIRFPVFWLSFKNFPLSIIKLATKQIIHKDNFVNFYFHPWEFTNIKDKEKLNLPFYISRLSGEKMIKKLENFISWSKMKGYTFKNYWEQASFLIEDKNTSS